MLQAAGGWFYAIEAKWRADFSAKQGHAHGTSQLEMRALSVTGNEPHSERRGVIVVVPRPPRYPPANHPKSVFRRYFDPDGERYKPRAVGAALRAVAVTWDDVAEILVQRSELAMVAQYLQWRLDNLPKQ